MPFSQKRYRNYFPLFPAAIEQFDLSGFDVIISTSHCVAKGVLTHSDQMHICYCYTPVRYAWDLYQQYLQESGLSKKMSELDLMDALRSDTEQIYRPFEKEQFRIAKRICEVSGGINLGDQFSIDFAEREVPMSTDEEIKYYSWAFQNDLETRQSYLRKKNPDLQEEEITAIVEQIDQERPQEADETQSIIDRIGEQVG